MEGTARDTASVYPGQYTKLVILLEEIKMGLQVYNTITKRKEEFQSITPGYVGMYVCGPTVYGMPHLGHAKSSICFDVIFRYFKFLGYKVKYVQNITDIGHLVGDADEGDDKIQRQARLEQLDPVEIAYRYEREYFDAMRQMNVLPPSISCRATGHIIEIQQMVQKILDAGYAYVTDEGNVYFDVSRYSDYGSLSGRSLDNTVSGERITIAGDKRNPEDFALWKRADAAHIMRWPSPWGDGYPGWHIECSAMSLKYLGKTFDIHGGGMDNIFPHHECECAQSTVANGAKFVNYFLHNNLVTVDGKKMGKSLNNFTALPDLFKLVSPIAVRFYVLLTHYRRPTDFVLERIQKNEEIYCHIGTLVDQARERCGKQSRETLGTGKMSEILREFLAAMDSDFNTALAISQVLQAEKILKEAMNADNMEVITDCVAFFDRYVDPILGLPFHGREQVVESTALTDQLAKLLIELRGEFKAEKNYAKADEVRERLKEMGVELQDTREGTTYRLMG